MIPFIPPPSLQPTRINTPDAGAAARTAPTQALGSLAQGIADISSAFGEQAERIQQLENTRMESMARQNVAKKMADFKIRAQSFVDPSMILTELEKTLSETAAFADNPELAPVTRDRLSLWHSDLAANARINAAQGAAKLTLRRTGAALQNEADDAFQANDETALDDVLSRSIDAGLMLPEEADSQRTKFQAKKTYDSIISSIDADPSTALQQVEADDFTERYPTLTAEHQSQLIRYARTKKNYEAAETWDAIQIASLEGGVLSREDILGMAKEGDISPTQAGQYLRAYHSPEPPQHDPILFDQIRSQILAYDPAADETGEQRALLSAQIATLPLPKETIAELSEQYKSRANPTPEQAKKHKLSREYADRLETEWNAEAFGDWFDMQKDATDGKIARKIIRAKDFDAALSYKNRFSNAFNTWLETQPAEIDPLEVGKKYDELKQQALDESMPLDLSPPPVFVPAFDDVDSLYGDEPMVLPLKDALPDGQKTSQMKLEKPIKLANYGYAGDYTSDTNSNVKKIGHKNNPLHSRSVAFSKSLADRLGLQHDDWVELNTTQGRFVKQYSDTVPPTHKGQPQPETIDLYRPVNGSNAWGGQVLGVKRTTPPQAYQGSIEDRKTSFFRSMRPRTPAEVQIGLEALYADYFTEAETD